MYRSGRTEVVRPMYRNGHVPNWSYPFDTCRIYLRWRAVLLEDELLLPISTSLERKHPRDTQLPRRSN